MTNDRVWEFDVLAKIQLTVNISQMAMTKNDVFAIVTSSNQYKQYCQYNENNYQKIVLMPLVI